MHNIVKSVTLSRRYLSELNIDVASLRRRGWNLCGYPIMQDNGLEHRGSFIQSGVQAGDPRSSHVIPRFDVLPFLTDQRNAPLMIVMRPLRLCSDVAIQRMQVVLNYLSSPKRICMM